jgi:catechol 2,3-dioxygenase-like lactoylglutathione lyase family enzyme
MPVIGMHHAGRTVQVMENVLPFYCKLLGLQVVDDEFLEGQEFSRLVGVEEAKVRAVMLSVDGQVPFVELVEFLWPDSRLLSGTEKTSDVGNAHFCLLVDDIHAEYERLREAGIRFTGPPIVADEGRFKGEWAAYCFDPEGQAVELWALSKEPG